MPGCLISLTAQAREVSINVYLKLKPHNQVTCLISEFNHFLQDKGLFTSYGIKPFIQDYPLHITLYLTTYNVAQIPAIMKQTQHLAKHHKSFSIITGSFYASPSGYVMLDVGLSQSLHQLSYNTLMTLAGLRNHDAKIPQWAAQDPKRQQIFMQWGSPGVMNYYQPHFSIFDPEHLKKKPRGELYKKLQPLVSQFNKKNRVKVNAAAYAIGVGLANRQGQITKELAMFTLNDSDQ